MKKPHKCSVCQKTFKSVAVLNQHSETHKPKNERNFYPCTICGKELLCKKGLIMHHELQHGAAKDIRDHICGFCSNAFKTAVGLRMHMTTHTKEKTNFNCKLCGRKYFQKFSLNNHIYTKHNTNLVVVLNKPLNNMNSLCCPKCAIGPFYSVSALSKHLAIHVRAQEQKPNNRCSICNATFRNINRHMAKTHTVDLELEQRANENTEEVLVKKSSRQKPFKCNPATNSCRICKKTFKTKRNLKVHMNLHSGERSFQCSICSSTFYTKGNLKIHVNGVHLKLDKYSCKFCKKSFSYRNVMDIHIRSIHTGDRPFKCNYCEKVFIQSSHRRMHEQRIHLKMKPFSCAICKKDFTEKINMENHIRTHTREKPYPCRNIDCNKSFTCTAIRTHHEKTNHVQKMDWPCLECGKVFSAKDYRDVHVKRVHLKQKRVECPICKKTFFDTSGRDIHVRTHTGETPYQCQYCAKAFISCANKTKHEKTKHNQKETEDTS